MVTNMIATIGENMRVRRAARLSVEPGRRRRLRPQRSAPDVGRIGVLVALEGAGDKAALRELGRKIAMHVAGHRLPAVAGRPTTWTRPPSTRNAQS